MSKLYEKLSDKNINFLIGSGASCPIFETLSLGNEKPTLEDILSSNDITETNKKAIYYFYYKNWIEPMKCYEYSDENITTLYNYQSFIEKILDVLDTNSNERPKRANIFTTNYDLLFEYTFEKILENRTNCYFNDGSRGFINRTLSPQSYNLSISETGYYDVYKKEVSTVNLLKMHGSVSWCKKDDALIEVEYNSKFENIQDIVKLDNVDFKNELIPLITDKSDLSHFNDKLTSITSSITREIDMFYEQYKSLAIINPDKWKFYETVFEQHYYQLIRNFSYELEKPNTILIIFAFSFADEHIEEIFKRSLSNPQLEVLIICYSQEEQNKLKQKFSGFKNIFYYPESFEDKEGMNIKGDFTYLNALFNGDYDE